MSEPSRIVEEVSEPSTIVEEDMSTCPEAPTTPVHRKDPVKRDRTAISATPVRADILNGMQIY